MGKNARHRTPAGARSRFSRASTPEHRSDPTASAEIVPAEAAARAGAAPESAEQPATDQASAEQPAAEQSRSGNGETTAVALLSRPTAESPAASGDAPPVSSEAPQAPVAGASEMNEWLDEGTTPRRRGRHRLDTELHEFDPADLAPRGEDSTAVDERDPAPDDANEDPDRAEADPEQDIAPAGAVASTAEPLESVGSTADADADADADSATDAAGEAQPLDEPEQDADPDGGANAEPSQDDGHIEVAPDVWTAPCDGDAPLVAGLGGATAADEVDASASPLTGADTSDTTDVSVGPFEADAFAGSSGWNTESTTESTTADGDPDDSEERLHAPASEDALLASDELSGPLARADVEPALEGETEDVPAADDDHVDDAHAEIEARPTDGLLLIDDGMPAAPSADGEEAQDDAAPAELLAQPDDDGAGGSTVGTEIGEEEQPELETGDAAGGFDDVVDWSRSSEDASATPAAFDWGAWSDVPEAVGEETSEDVHVIDSTDLPQAGAAQGPVDLADEPEPAVGPEQTEPEAVVRLSDWNVSVNDLVAAAESGRLVDDGRDQETDPVEVGASDSDQLDESQPSAEEAVDSSDADGSVSSPAARVDESAEPAPALPVDLDPAEAHADLGPVEILVKTETATALQHAETSADTADASQTTPDAGLKRRRAPMVGGKSVVGLDFGLGVIRAAEVVTSAKGRPLLVRYAQVAIAREAVKEGVVVDQSAVVSALKTLWKTGGFKTRSVIIGMGSQQVLIRELTVPAMPLPQLRETLPFRVQDTLPLPVDEALLDFLPTEEVDGPEGKQLRGLLIAATKESVLSNARAIEGAGLRILDVDLIPFALSREAFGDGRSMGTEILVHVGGSSTTIVVTLSGVPQFVRTLPAGGDDVTAGIVERLGVNASKADALKRSVGIVVDAAASQEDQSAARAAQFAVGDLVRAMRSTISFYRNAHDDVDVDRVLLSGGGGLLPGLGAALGTALDLPVDVPRTGAGFDVGPKIDTVSFVSAGPAPAVALGLTLRSIAA